ncbi:SHOCT domain-containing protein [Halogeometricum borinquense]|uniref:SHOCT domain-containing protein n=2 Tax=Halogeometricum borinquense TaxID=60847 RepID=A0A482TGS2_9EURY|nr:SHOCT domain-containing protein [Halogeometricum borinquense]
MGIWTDQLKVRLMATNTTNRRLIALVLIALGALILLPTLFMGFGTMGYGPMMGGEMWGQMWGTGGTVPMWVPLAGLVMQLVFLAVIGAVAYLVYKAITGPERTGDRALEELRVAYARGDLTDEEYEDRRKTLKRE